MLRSPSLNSFLVGLLGLTALIFQTMSAAAQLTPHCPGRWTPSSAGPGMDCRCADGSFATPYSAGSRLKFRCRASTRRRESATRVACGGGRYCKQGFKCSRTGRKCLPANAVDCGAYHCKAGSRCGRGWRACVTKDKVDCGPKAKGVCAAGRTCWTASFDQASKYTKGKTYCLTKSEFATVRDMYRQKLQSLRDELRTKRAALKRLREEKQKRVAQNNNDGTKPKKTTSEPGHRDADPKVSKDDTTTTLVADRRTRLAEAKSRVLGLQYDTRRAIAVHAKRTERARQAYLAVNQRLLEQAGRWNKARAAGDVRKSRQLHKELTQTRRQAQTHQRKYQKLKGTQMSVLDRTRLARALARAKSDVEHLDQSESRPNGRVSALLNKSLTPTALRRSKKPQSHRSRVPTGSQSGSADVQPEAKRNTRIPVSPRTSEPPTFAKARQFSRKTPVQQAKIKEIMSSYNNKKGHVRLVAQNADYASLASAAYSPKTKFILSGWKRLYTLPYDNKRTGSNVASVYRSDANGEIVVAFQGSNDGADWRGTNLRSLSRSTRSETGQIDWVRNTARALHRKYGRNVTFVGHSLGGRLARIARSETGRKAVVFDTAFLSDTEFTQEKSLQRVDQLLAFRSPEDPVSRLRPQGVRSHDVRNFIFGNTLQAHSHEQLARAMQDAKNVYSWIEETSPDR